MSKGVLLNLITDKLSSLLKKGELITNYYNPGNLFDEVHLVMIGQDISFSKDAIQHTVGNAKLFVHCLNIDRKMTILSFGWRNQFLVNKYKTRFLTYLNGARPNLIRCYGMQENAILAAEAFKVYGVPYVVSMHTNPDDSLEIVKSWAARLYYSLITGKLKESLSKAAMLMPVYSSIVPYINRLGLSNYEIFYNILSLGHIQLKNNYHSSHMLKMVSVGRQIIGKNPIHILEAILEHKDVHLTLIGDGTLHNMLKEFVADQNISDQVVFIRSMPNSEICKMLPEFDLFIAHCDYLGVPKSVMEPMLSGLPIILNVPKKPIAEYGTDTILFVDNTKEAYVNAIRQMKSEDLRIKFARASCKKAWEMWDPKNCEAKVTALYKKLVDDDNLG